MNRLFIHILWAWVATTLVACGGGGNSATGLPAAPNSLLALSTVPLRTALANTLTGAGTFPFNIRTLSATGISNVGTGTLTIGPLSAAMLSPQNNGKQLTVKFETSFAPTLPNREVTALVYDNLLPFATVEPGDYQAYNYQLGSIPELVTVGAAGPLYTVEHFTDVTRQSPTGRNHAVTYSVEADTTTTALLKVIAKGQLGLLPAAGTYTTTEVYRVTPTGTISCISKTTVLNTGETITMTF